ncbi:hypothetical protein C7Y72_08535 [Paraconexibacter algicola]|uniref:Uncharacterized protein n=1 Tax=Paraconexibacter algicola TaxID=2133960 RepID=A0A2T4UKC2_9ACTN|nr:hypothetical protein C7Y72_08535 [Paraconexibacter algicola]
MPALLQPPRRVGEDRAGDHRPRDRGAELPRQQVRPGERERGREQEQQRVPRQGRLDPVPGNGERRVPDEGVRQGQRVPHRPELVALEERARLLHQRMAAPGQLPGLRERVAEVLRDVAAEVQHQRPEHRDRQERRADGEHDELAGRQPR